MATTMAADNVDNEVDGDGATCNDDGNDMTGDDKDDDDNSDNDGNDDGDGMMGDGATGYDNDNDGDGRRQR